MAVYFLKSLIRVR